MSASEVERTKEGVPKWDGSASTFTAYEEACYLYEAGTEAHMWSPTDLGAEWGGEENGVGTQPYCG